MLLTRIVTIYRQWSFLGRWINAPGLFDDPNVAWVVCNDAPDDPCPADLRARLAAHHVSLLEPAFNLGRSAARNLGARAARSPWIEFIDGDDIPLPVDTDWLRSAPSGHLLHYPHRTYALVENDIVPAVGLEPPHPFFWDIGFIQRLPVINCRPACLIFPVEAFSAAGGFDGRYDTCEDLHLLWKLDQTRIEALQGPAPKQLYRRGDTTSCDPEMIGFYTHRLLRLGARRIPPGGSPSGIVAAADRQALRAVRALLDELESKERARPVDGQDLSRDMQDLHWRARRLYTTLCKPGWTVRLREAVKLLLAS